MIQEAMLAWDVLQNAGGNTDEWWNTMINEQGDSLSGESETAPYTTVFLLSMLPNLNKLQLAPAYGDFDGRSR
jgi:hypothetical protein